MAGDGANALTIGDATNPAGTIIRASAGVLIQTGTTTRLVVGASTITVNVASLLFSGTGVVNPSLSQAVESTINTSQSLTVQAQNNTHGAGTSTGGVLNLTSGTGTLASGATNLQAGGVTKLSAGDDGLGYFGHARAGQAADMIAITDSTGGAISTTVNDAGVVYNQATLNNNFATLAAQIDKVRTALRAPGFMA